MSARSMTGQSVCKKFSVGTLAGLSLMIAHLAPAHAGRELTYPSTVEPLVNLLHQGLLRSTWAHQTRITERTSRAIVPFRYDHSGRQTLIELQIHNSVLYLRRVGEPTRTSLPSVGQSVSRHQLSEQLERDFRRLHDPTALQASIEKVIEGAGLQSGDMIFAVQTGTRNGLPTYAAGMAHNDDSIAWRIAANLDGEYSVKEISGGGGGFLSKSPQVASWEVFID